MNSPDKPLAPLSACPFCGSAATFHIECALRECGCRTIDWYPLEAAIAVWNRRVSSSAEADARRLDFLDRMNASLNQHYGTDYGWRLIINHNVVRLLRDSPNMAIDLHDSAARGLKSCRAAIDEAMSR